MPAVVRAVVRAVVFVGWMLDAGCWILSVVCYLRLLLVLRAEISNHHAEHAGRSQGRGIGGEIKQTQ